MTAILPAPLLPAGIEQALRGADADPPELDRLMRKARAATDFLKALSNESRLLLLCLLVERERSVGELESLMSLRQPNVSQQLARLRLDGLVDTRREGKTIYYRLANPDVLRMIGTIYDIFCRDEAARGDKPGAPG